MSRCLLCYSIGGLMLLGCYQGPAPSDAPSDRSSTIDPHAGMLPKAAAPESASGKPLGDAGGPLKLDAIILTAPAGWQQIAPSSSFIAAEFALPRAQGDDADGRLTVSTAGGTVEANIERWKGQFDAQVKQSPPEEVEVAGLKVTVVDMSGTFNDQRGPIAPPTVRPGYRMIAAVVPVEGQLHFIKATGPEKTIAAHADKIHEFIRTVQRQE